MTMKRIECIKCSKYRKFKYPQISNIFNKKLVLFLIYDKSGSTDEKYSKERNLLR